MALQGTLKDFALPDILQLIGIQRKTGVLTMEDHKDKVTVQFFQGNVVGADNSSRQIEECLGTVLVRTGRISEIQLQEALAIQRETLQRLGYVLVKSGYLRKYNLTQYCSFKCPHAPCRSIGRGGIRLGEKFAIWLMARLRS